MTTATKTNNRKNRKPLTTDDIKKGYKRPEIDATNRAGAHFFDWAASKHAHKVVPWNVAFFGIYGKRKGLKSKEVENLRSQAGAIRKVLKRDYERSLATFMGLGVRATVDSEDVARTEGIKTQTRVRSSIESMVSTHDLIKIGEIRDPKLRKYVRDRRSIMKLLGSDDVLLKLLPPAADDESDE